MHKMRYLYRKNSKSLIENLLPPDWEFLATPVRHCTASVPLYRGIITVYKISKIYNQ